jgi:hypothetical protein
MRIDIGRYRANFTWMNRIFDRERAKEGFDRLLAVSQLSALTGVPVIAALHFYGEMYGYCEGLRSEIQNNMTFYGYTCVDGCQVDDSTQK